MFPFGLHSFGISMVFAIVQVKHATALQYTGGVLFEKDMAYDGIVSNDESFYIKSFTRVGRTRCCVNCEHDRPSCVGVLYNREQMKCKLLKRHLTMAGQLGNIGHEEWEYWKIPKDSDNGADRNAVLDEAADCKRTTSGWDYTGKINVTKTGRTCAVWPFQSPQPHVTGTDQPENYCRNPDGQPTPWCYTTDPDVQFELCNIPMCDTPPLECLTSQDPTGRSYFGTQNVADTGDLCQRWDRQSPHEHKHPHLADQDNYCRNPDGEGAPWCYTVNYEIRWSKCIIPRC